MNDIVAQNKGQLVESHGKSIFIPHAEISNYGCSNCVWKSHNQCPYGLTGDQIYPSDIHAKESYEPLKNMVEDSSRKKGETPSLGPIGICTEMLQFLSGLADKTGSIDSVHEKFLIYKTRLQETSDYKEMLELNDKIKILEKELYGGVSKYSKEELQQRIDNLRMDKTAAKMYWMKLNEYSRTGLQKVLDRKSKESGPAKLPGIMSSGTINFNITNKEIEQK